MADYIFTMIRASKFYGANRKVLEDITLCGISSATGRLCRSGANHRMKMCILRSTKTRWVI